MSDKQTFLTPVGRVVMGDIFEGRSKDAEGNPLTIRSGPNAGQPRQEWFFGLAIPKTDASFSELYTLIMTTARQSFPNLFDASGNCIAPQFAFKIIDGDSTVPNTKGIKPCDREGFPGHYILSFSGGYPPTVYATGGKEIIVDPKAVKRGDYIRVYGSVAGNDSHQRPGVYLNHNLVEFIGYGDPIVTGPDGAAIFGGAPAASIPAGASATPIAPAATIAAPMAAPAAAPVAPAPMAAPAVAPAPDFLNPPAAPAAEPAYTVNGARYTESQLKGFGWSAEQIAALPRA